MTAVGTTRYLRRHRFPVWAGQPARTVNRIKATTGRTDGDGDEVCLDRPVARRECAGFPPLTVSPPLIRARPRKKMTLPATLSGFRLTHPAGPMRRLSASLGPRGADIDAESEKTATHPTPCTCHRPHDDVFQHSELLRITTSVAQGRKGVSQSPERKNPGGAFWGHQPGFLWDPREVPGCSGNLPDMSCEGYVIPFPFQLMGR